MTEVLTFICSTNLILKSYITLHYLCVLPGILTDQDKRLKVEVLCFCFSQMHLDLEASSPQIHHLLKYRRVKKYDFGWLGLYLNRPPGGRLFIKTTKGECKLSMSSQKHTDIHTQTHTQKITFIL